jgi:hypothetical protein
MRQAGAAAYNADGSPTATRTGDLYRLFETAQNLKPGRWLGRGMEPEVPHAVAPAVARAVDIASRARITGFSSPQELRW